MKNLILLTLSIIITLSMSSCIKKWTCTCTHYTQHFGTNGTVTTLRTSNSTITGTKKSGQKDCKYAEQLGKEDAVAISADPNEVNCTLK